MNPNITTVDFVQAYRNAKANLGRIEAGGQYAEFTVGTVKTDTRYSKAGRTKTTRDRITFLTVTEARAKFNDRDLARYEAAKAHHAACVAIVDAWDSLTTFAASAAETRVASEQAAKAPKAKAAK